jgi:ribosomal protein L15E
VKCLTYESKQIKDISKNKANKRENREKTSACDKGKRLQNGRSSCATVRFVKMTKQAKP